MTTGDRGVGDRLAERMLQRMLSVGIDGFGPFDSAETVAAAALARGGPAEAAIDEIVKRHSRLAATNGFVTGLGGLITMIVALPVNVAVFSMLAARMSAAIASIRGHDLADLATRTAVLLALTGNNASDLMAKAGVAVPGGRITTKALQRLPQSTLAFINKGVAFRVLTRTLGKGVARFGRLVPLLGGLIGAVIDRTLIRSIARTAPSELRDSRNER